MTDFLSSSAFSPACLARSDADFMRAALSLGRWGLGRTGENPSVGALLAKEGVVVGQGWTQDGGRPHAETQALAQAGARAQGATLYVTLEPCSHQGRTPPCVEAIAAAGVARVVSAMDDPDPRVKGRGHAFLAQAGIEVLVGVLGEDALRAHLGHVLSVREGRAMVCLKLAETRDGYSAGDEHDGRLAITSAPANARTQVLRAMHDSIMLGVKTVLIDDPLLTVRVPGLEGRKPLRVVLDARLELPTRSRLATGARDAPVLAIAAEGADLSRARRLQDSGVQVDFIPLDQHGRLNLRKALELLAARGHRRVFSEGGPRIAQSLIMENLADEVVLLSAPKPLGRPGIESLSPPARAALANQAKYLLFDDGRIGPDRVRIYHMASYANREGL